MSSVSDFDSADITAAILAGGEGKRVDGRDKGLLALAGKPLVERVATALRGKANTILICVNRHPHEYAVFGQVVSDTSPGFRGPLAGIASALASCTTPWLLTVPVDAPDFPIDLAQRLYAAAVAADSALAVAHDGVRSQPLFALYRAPLAQSAQVALDHDLAVWRWQEQLGAATTDFSDRPQAFANLNTLAAMRDWEREHGQ